MHYKLFVSLFFLSIGAAQIAHACSCEWPLPISKAVAQSDAIFAGEVVSITTVDDERRVSFRVLRALEGVGETAVVWTEADTGAGCGFPFQEGERYLVYARRYKGDLGTSNCTRTAEVRHAEEDLVALGLDSDPVCGGPDNFAALQTVFFVLVGAAFLHRKRSI